MEMIFQSYQNQLLPISITLHTCKKFQFFVFYVKLYNILKFHSLEYVEIVELLEVIHCIAIVVLHGSVDG